MAAGFLGIITGSFARPAAENPTVAMVEAAYRHHGLNARYLNCEVAPERLGDAVRGAVAMGWHGFNCSLPHKVAVVPLLDRLAPSAAVIGAVNCVVIGADGSLTGENTDGQGFLTALREVLDPAGARVLLLGAGGAARACGVELALAGAAEVLVANRSAARGAALAGLIGERTPARARALPWDGELAVPSGVDVLVNATSVGLHPDGDARLPLDLAGLGRGAVVADVIPNPPRTRLLRDAAARGHRTLDGLGMLVNQGVLGIRLWTGLDADPAVMRAALEGVLPG